MTETAPQDMIARLQQALTANLLTGDRAFVGQTVLDHLQKPTRITAIGAPDAGKTSLLNMILGTRDMPDLQDVSMVELVYGPAPRFRIETETNAAQIREGLVNATALPADAMRVVQELPRALLQGRSFAEVNLPRDGAPPQHVLEWLAETSDITLWCTQNFDDRESAIWTRVPQNLKDNSFLVITKADQLKMKGLLAAQTAHFETTCADDFLGLHSVATKQACAARGTGAVTNPDQWASSGGKGLLTALTEQMTSGKAGDLDYAEMLLAQVKDQFPEVLPVLSEGPLNDADMPEVAEVVPAVQPGSELSPMKRGEAFETALRILSTCAEDMSAPLPDTNAPAPETILNHSVHAAQALATLLMDADGDDPDVNVLRDEVLESEQLILLLQLEGTESAANDAVTTLLQIKKDVAEVAFA